MRGRSITNRTGANRVQTTNVQSGVTIAFLNGVQFTGPSLQLILTACAEYQGIGTAPAIATGGGTGARSAPLTTTSTTPRRQISAEGRRRIAAAQKRRWARKGVQAETDGATG